MKTVTIEGKKVQLPSSWKELSKENIRFVLQQFCQGTKAVEIKLLLLCRLMAWKPFTSFINKQDDGCFRVNDRAGRVLKIKAESVHNLILLFAFLDTADGYFLSPFKTVKLKGKLYHGVSDRLANLTYGEYQDAENYLRRYNATGTKEDLNKLLATVYRPLFKGKKQVYHEDDCIGRRDLFNAFPKWLALHTVMLFDGSKRVFARTFPDVFASAKTDGDTIKGIPELTAINTLCDYYKVTPDKARSIHLIDVLQHFQDEHTKIESYGKKRSK